MKFIVNLILIVFLIPSVLIFALTLNTKYQLLETNFWKYNFDKNNVYASLSRVVRVYAEDQTMKNGGETEDLKILTDLINPVLIKDFAEGNLDNFLGFINGRSSGLFVYVPIDKIPKELAPKSIDLNMEQIPFVVLLSKFNIDTKSVPVSQIAYLGMYTNYLMVVSGLFIAAFSWFLFLNCKKGGRLVSLGISFVIAGLVLICMNRILNIFDFMAVREITYTGRLDVAILKIILPPILRQVSNTWIWSGLAIISIGFLLFKVKRPLGKNDQQNI